MSANNASAFDMLDLYEGHGSSRAAGAIVPLSKNFWSLCIAPATASGQQTTAFRHGQVTGSVPFVLTRVEHPSELGFTPGEGASAACTGQVDTRTT